MSVKEEFDNRGRNGGGWGSKADPLDCFKLRQINFNKVDDRKQNVEMFQI